jgi:anti-anti-sigma regulatory factor
MRDGELLTRRRTGIPAYEDSQCTGTETIQEMNNPTSNVTVKQLPATFDAKQQQRFLHELEECWSVSRPRIVLDCANARQVDHSFVHLLLCSLEEAMKRNGDVRLAGIGPEAKTILKLYGVDRLFKIFATNEEAIESYQSPHEYPAPHTRVIEDGRIPGPKGAA